MQAVSHGDHLSHGDHFNMYQTAATTTYEKTFHTISSYDTRRHSSCTEQKSLAKQYVQMT